MKNPADRLRASYGDELKDVIFGILLGFKYKLDEREGWIDIITCREADAEIRQLLEDYKKGKIK